MLDLSYIIPDMKARNMKDKQKKIQQLKSQIIEIEEKYPYNPRSDFNDGSHECFMESIGYYKLYNELSKLTDVEFLKVDGVWQV